MADEDIEELKRRLAKYSNNEKSNSRLPERLIQVISLVLGFGLLLLDLFGLLAKPVPTVIYPLFIGGFFSGYKVSNLLEKFGGKPK